MTSDLRSAKYLLLTTFRRDGTAVDTPVWVVAEGELLYAWSNAEAGKVKRLRRDGTVRVAPCTVRGSQTGPAVPATATLVDAEGTAKVVRMINKKYGLLGRLTTLRAKPAAGRTIGIRIELDPRTTPDELD
ncbi:MULTISPECIES: PPOX class F420-dependent oxidoreductase [unclassified Crossiella]|uniref:PPOX class F420-dependent oxidoreductase n=1 Tax=unclassified Crossiella TaxID=2620835 RepID=UPI001FFE4948|nr:MULTISPECIES: PPOX class F420-dependent oxidoreductase [unclassified Crossiella]MCK2243273.1 PPOX class F420-dependent oxidoreductase [Crossiella sp. S99.2]MCK2254258.1 PPOX class F420-dependent oxidoreductase [Crossiella sp. S99.1]